MAEVTPLIYIGGWSAARDVGRFFDVIVNVAIDAQTFGAYQFKLVDGPGNKLEDLVAAIECTAQQIRENKKMLIHCVGGRSRSVVVLAAALEQECGWSFHETVERIRVLRATSELPMAPDQPHHALVELLQQREKP